MRITMNKDVIITMEGIQHDVDETEALIETVKGQYFKKNDSIYLLYQLPNKEATLKGRIKIKGETVEVIQGNSRLFFEVGKETTSFYPSPMGEILMELDTNVLKIEEEEDSLLVEFKYHLKMNGMYISRCTMKIVVVSDIEKET